MTEEVHAIPSAAARPPVSRTDPAGSQGTQGRRSPAAPATTEQPGQPATAAPVSVVEELNEVLEARDISLRFTVDEEADQIVVTVTDRQTGDVIRQIPPDEHLRIAAHLRELLGVLINQTA